MKNPSASRLITVLNIIFLFAVGYLLTRSAAEVAVNVPADLATLETAGKEPGVDSPIANLNNPAAVYCTDVLGYEYQTLDDGTGGQTGVCVMPDGKACNDWDFLAGKCGTEFSYCATLGFETRTVTEGGVYLPEHAVCVDEDGVQVGPVEELSNLDELSRGCGGEVPLESSTGPRDRPLPESSAEIYGTTTGLEALPASFDWRNASYLGVPGNWISPIKNQGGCGSCWAFSAVGVAEAAFNFAATNPALDLDLSEEYLVSDCHTYSGAQTCCGGWHNRALQFIRDTGIPDEGCMPYADGSSCSCGSGGCETNCTYNTDGKCSDVTCGDRCGDYSSRLMTIDEYGYAGSDPAAIKSALLNYGPLAVALNMSGSWDGDIFRCTDDDSTSHAVSIIGYDDASSYWIVKNSWGATWNGDGTFRVGYGECAIENYVYYNWAGSTQVISGYVLTGTGIGIPDVRMAGLPGNTYTNFDGYYGATVPKGWSGTVVPEKVGYTFNPPSTTYTSVISDQVDQNYLGITHVISGYVLDGTGTGISNVRMDGFPETTYTDGGGFYSAIVPEGWSGTVIPEKLNYSFDPVSNSYTFVTSDQADQDYTGTFVPSGNSILLVDDDDNHPDVLSYYGDALTALGEGYDVWHTHGSDVEPDADFLASYDTVIWFTGYNYYSFTGPGTEGVSALSSWLNGGGCFLLSSQDYLFSRGLTTFASTYLGVGYYESDKFQLTATGTGSVFSGLGPYTLSYPFNNYSDIIMGVVGTETAFVGDKGYMALNKYNGTYHTAFLGFPLEAIPTQADREDVLGTFLNWCGTDLFSLDVVKQHTGSGIVTSTPSGISCGSDCVEAYAPGTVIKLTATASPGSLFTGWGGPCSGLKFCWVTMSTARTVTASFTQIPPGTYPLTVVKGGAGSGTATSTPAGISCGTDCWEFYTAGTAVRLSAAASPGSTFIGWSGACGSLDYCWLGMGASKYVTANFALTPAGTYPLLVAMKGKGTGTVTSNLPGISCWPDCYEFYTSGTLVRLAAVAAPGSTFTGWSGACGGTAYCWVTMSQARFVTANWVLTITSVPPLDADLALLRDPFAFFTFLTRPLEGLLP